MATRVKGIRAVLVNIFISAQPGNTNDIYNDAVSTTKMSPMHFKHIQMLS